MKKSLSIIGYGAFGKFIAGFLKPYFELYAYDVRKTKDIKTKEDGIKFVSLKEAASKEIVILAVNMDHFENVVKKIKRFVRKDSLVIDVCSVKVEPVKIMKKHLKCQIIATHPLFGPHSGRNGIKELKIVIYPVKIDATEFNVFKRFLKNRLKLNVIENTPQEHDREMAFIQVITHLVGRAVNKTNLPDLKLSTYSYEKLKEMARIVGHDSGALFRTIQRYNKFAPKVRKKFVNTLLKISKSI